MLVRTMRYKVHDGREERREAIVVSLKGWKGNSLMGKRKEEEQLRELRQSHWEVALYICTYMHTYMHMIPLRNSPTNPDTPP
jgi:sulfur relay (sulfurtransferase) DsrC/TusE family protein